MHLVAKPKITNISAPILRCQTCRVLEDVIGTLDLLEFPLGYAGKFDCIQIKRKKGLILLSLTVAILAPYGVQFRTWITCEGGSSTNCSVELYEPRPRGHMLEKRSCRDYERQTGYTHELSTDNV